MTSDARIAANRRNAQHSTGPRTAAGKARSSQNPTKHGLTSARICLPGEDTQAYDRQLAEWFRYYDARDPGRGLLVEQAVHASWRLDRCACVEAAALAERVRHAADHFDLAAAARAEDL